MRTTSCGCAHSCAGAFPRSRCRCPTEVAPLWREYERGSTVIADSYVKPVIQDYVSSTRQELAAKRLHMPWALMKSNGGRTTPELAEAEPIQLLLSGLADGLIAGHFFGQHVGLDNLVTLDMGGTSCDVGLIRGGRIGYSTNFEIEFGLPVAILNPAPVITGALWDPMPTGSRLDADHPLSRVLLPRRSTTGSRCAWRMVSSGSRPPYFAGATMAGPDQVPNDPARRITLGSS